MRMKIMVGKWSSLRRKWRGFLLITLSLSIRIFLRIRNRVRRALMRNPLDKRIEIRNLMRSMLTRAKNLLLLLKPLLRELLFIVLRWKQTDVIDLILAEKDSILKEIQIDMIHKKSQKNIIGVNEKQENNVEKRYQEDNLYYSWRKRKELQFKMKSNQRQPRAQSPFQKDKVMDKTVVVQKFHKSLKKSNSINSNLGRQKSRDISRKDVNKRAASVFSRVRQNKKVQPTERSQRQEMENIESQRIHQNGSTMMTNWRHMVNFEPKTEIGKQLCEDIKKKNSPSDELGIKRTIIEFLVNYKELINNEVINKVTLSQKIQKLYSEDAKELLMFYPSKIGTFDTNAANTSHCKDNSVDDKFLDLLKNITEGPLIKYWRQLQESKI